MLEGMRSDPVSYLVHTPALIPEHTLLSESDAKKIAKKYGVPLEKFPKIHEGDPQAKALGAKIGSLVAISRDDPTGKTLFYRLVVKG